MVYLERKKRKKNGHKTINYRCKCFALSVFHWTRWDIFDAYANFKRFKINKANEKIRSSKCFCCCSCCCCWIFCALLLLFWTFIESCDDGFCVALYISFNSLQIYSLFRVSNQFFFANLSTNTINSYSVGIHVQCTKMRSMPIRRGEKSKRS